jgi:hypothetical protein
VALAAHWPGNFFAGNGTARLYLDTNTTEQQRQGLEAIFDGKKGGMFEAVFGGVISSWLPAQATKVDIACRPRCTNKQRSGDRDRSPFRRCRSYVANLAGRPAV